MLLTDLPPEVIDNICQYLPTIDEICLRLSSNKIGGNDKERYSLDSHYNPPKRYPMDRTGWLTHTSALESVELYKRFFRDGEILHPEKEGHCIRCLKIKNIDKFSITKEIKFDGHRICNGCHARMMRDIVPVGHTITYNGTEYFTCQGCEESKRAQYVHKHANPDNGEHKASICVECHWELCKDYRCLGWPKGWVYKYFKHFGCFPKRTCAKGECDHTTCKRRRARLDKLDTKRVELPLSFEPGSDDEERILKRKRTKVKNSL